MSGPACPSEAGWPRPKAEWKAGGRMTYAGGSRGAMPDRLPVPWMNGPCVAQRGDWHSFRDDAWRAHAHRLCAVCGERMEGLVVLGQFGHHPGETSGPGGHPRCMWLAVNSCPHLAEQGETVAWSYDGPGNGYEISAEDGLQDGGVPENWGEGEPVSPGAQPLGREQLKALAKADPLGTGAT